MATSKPSEQSLFLAALELPTVEERAAYVRGACGDDPALQAAVEALLAAHERSENVLDAPPEAGGVPGVTLAHHPTPEGLGTLIGPYKLLQQIGEGGMGVVYMAEQEKPVRRKVALKIIKPGMDTREVIARFESERQALALMDHPNIARVLDAGATESGRPYFVMELVKGVRITDFCDQNHMPAGQRLELFVTVCNAVQHAHHKGIIHRDLKPANVMVTLHDGVPVVKVIDFGVAKATAQKLTERTLFTAYGQMVGTPAYMSPEQAEMSGLDIDTRSDIYSLGVLLYELLTGTTPLDAKRLRQAGFAEMQRLIREEESPRPSTRLSSLGGAATALANNRGSDPKRLAQLLRSDLDWIVMKALEKDRNRRYGSPSNFAADVERYLRHDAIEARPPSAAYKLRKLCQRNRAAVVTTAVVSAALVFGTVISTWQAVRATRERDEKEQARLAEATQRQEAESQRDRATKAETEAKEQAAIAQAVNDFLQNDLLAQASPNNEPDRDLKVRTLLDRAAQKIEGKFNQQPQVEGYIRYTLAETYVALTLFADAQPQIERALELCRRHLGEEHPHTLNCMYRLATVLREQSKYAESEALYRKALELQCRVLGYEHLSTSATMDGLAWLLHAQNKLAEAEPLYRKVLAIRRRVFGEEHLHTLESMLKIAQVLQRQGKLSAAEAESAHRRVLEARRRVQGNDHPDTLLATSNLAWQLLENGKLGEAERLSREGLETARRVLGEEHHRTLLLMWALGAVLRAQGDDAAAEPLLVKNLEIRRRVSGEEHRHTCSAVAILAGLYEDQRKFDLAEPLRVKQVELARRVHGPEHPALALALALLGSTRRQQQKFAEAEPVLRECLAIREKKVPDDWLTPNARWLLGDALRGQKKYAEAEPLLLQGYEGLQQRQATIPPQWSDRPTKALQTLVQLYDAWDKPDEAAKWRKKLEEAKAPTKATAKP